MLKIIQHIGQRPKLYSCALITQSDAIIDRYRGHQDVPNIENRNYQRMTREEHIGQL